MSTLMDGLNLFRKTPQHSVTKLIDTVDSEWALDGFMVKDTLLDPVDRANRYWSVTDFKFTDTSLGGNISINNYPQFTRYADLRRKGRVKDRNEVRVNDLNGDIGMGRYYGETMDDNAINVYLTFGVKEFNNLFRYLFSSVDYKQASIVSSGRSTIPYNLGFAVGRAALVIAFPVITISLWVIKSLYKFLLAPGRIEYYYMKPTMGTYWSTVNSLVSLMATELGILSPQFMRENNEPDKIGTPIKMDKEDLGFLKTYMPNIITEDNYIDVPSIALKAQRAANRQFLKDMEAYENGLISEDNFLGFVKKSYIENHRIPEASLTSKINKIMLSTEKYFSPRENKVTEEEVGGAVNEFKQDVSSTGKGFTLNDDGTANIPDSEYDDKSFINQVAQNFDATVREGARYLVFRVDDPGQVSESFTNSVTDIGLDTAMKGISSKTRSIQFSLSGGNLIPGLDDVGNMFKDVVTGFLDGATLGLSDVLSYLLGDANLEMVKRWEDSSASFPTTTFTAKLQSPYNNPISKLTNIYIPLATLLAGMLPRATGFNSYGSPFLCSMFLRGHQQIDLGMITSLTVTRGTSNLAFDKNRQPLAIDVSFTVTDFSKLITAPTSSNLLDPASIIYNDTAPLNRYIGALCGRSLYKSSYTSPKVKLKVSRFINETDHLMSPAYWGMKLGEMTPDVFKGMISSKGINYSDT